MTTVDSEPHTAAELIEAARQKYQNNVAYIEADVSTTLGAHLDDAERLASALRHKYGVGTGDRVAVLASTSRRYIALWHAALLGHFTIVPLNFRLAPAELTEVLRNAAPLILIHSVEYAELAVSSAAYSKSIPLLAIELMLSESIKKISPRAAVKPEGIAVIMYTSGTTGTPKGVAMTQRALCRTHQRQHAQWNIRDAGTCLYTTSPIFHVSGIYAILGPTLEGNRTVIGGNFEVAKLIRESYRYHVTHMVLISIMIDRVFDHPDFIREEQGQIRYISYGGAPIPSSTIDKMLLNLPKADIIQGYGMTEVIGAASSLNGLDHRDGGTHLRSVGRPLPGVEFRIRNAVGNLCEVAQTGEIEVSSDGMFGGYWNNPDATASAMNDGWFRSGDLGYVDADGYLFIIDRLKDMIITGGENVYPVEVERAIKSLPGIAQVAVFGVPSQAWGEQVHAVIVPAPGVICDSAGIIAELRKSLANYKCPKSIDIRTEPLPVSGTNKVNKRALRDEYRLATDG